VRVARNALILVALRVLMPALAVALVLTLSHRLGTAGLGRYTVAFSFLYMFNAVAPLGLGAIITREGARARGDLGSLLANALILGTGTSIALTFVMSGLAYGLDYDDETRRSIVVLSLAIVPCTIGMLQDSAFVALERMEYLAAATIVEYAVKVGGGVGLLLTGHGLEAVLLAAIAGRVLACIVSAFFLRRAGLHSSWRLELDCIRRLVRLAPAFLFIGIFATLYWRIDIFMLSKMRPIEDVGNYGAAWRILELAMVFPQSLCLSLFPQIASALSGDRSRIERIGREAVRCLISIDLPVAIGIALLARPIMALLYGPAFEQATATLCVLILTLVPYGIVRYHAYVLVGANRQNVDLMLNTIMSAVNIGLNLLLIPAYGHLGAAVATLASICAYGLLQYAYLLRALPHAAVRLFVPPGLLVACTAMAVVVWLCREYNVFAATAAGVVVYAGCLLAGGFLSQTEKELLGLARLQRLLR
jgi:O-antigen/teichoic acid export membrane protein